MKQSEWLRVRVIVTDDRIYSTEMMLLFDATRLVTQMNRFLLRIHVMKAVHRHDPDVPLVVIYWWLDKSSNELHAS